MNPVYKKVLRCYEDIQKKFDFSQFRPEVAIVLGSGLGDYASDIKVVGEVGYEEIEGFPVSTVPGHAGKFIFGYVGEIPVVCMKGRVHYYEGYPITDVVLPVRLMNMMGAKVLFLTNACGGLNPEFEAGDFMMITDHIMNFVLRPEQTTWRHTPARGRFHRQAPASGPRRSPPYRGGCFPRSTAWQSRAFQSRQSAEYRQRSPSG